jgi:hypothetical protein
VITKSGVVIPKRQRDRRTPKPPDGLALAYSVFVQFVLLLAIWHYSPATGISVIDFELEDVF